MKTNNEIAKLDSIIAKMKIKCKCGHTIYIPPHLNKLICTHCGNYVFKNKKDEFIYRINEIKRRNYGKES